MDYSPRAIEDSACAKFWLATKVNYGKSESGEFFNSAKQILLLRKIVSFYFCYLYAIQLDCKFVN